MKKLIANTGMALAFFIALPLVAAAAEMDHSKMGHGMNGPKVAMQKAVKKGQLSRLPVMPASGRAREAGSDGRYAMEPTSIRTRWSEKCAQATRGLVMLDNAAWKRCGGKPKGAAMGIKNQSEAKMDHSKMKH